MLIVFVSCCGLCLVFATLQLLLSVLGRVHTVVVIVSSTHHRTPLVNTQQVCPFLARMLQAYVFVLIIVFAHSKGHEVMFGIRLLYQGNMEVAKPFAAHTSKFWLAVKLVLQWRPSTSTSLVRVPCTHRGRASAQGRVARGR